jgi:phenylalanyl-tRNA synthetase beta chain
MKISLNWLTDYVDVAVPVARLTELLKQIGLPVEDVAETDTDIVLDVEVTSNRGDCLGHLGVAREVASVLGVEFRPPKIGPLPTSGRAADLTSVQVLAPDLCPRYTARVLRGVKIGPSPQWMVDRLEAMGLRGINNVVDVTNYILMEYSQPLHSFDYDKLAERRIVVRRAANGEMLVSIDETKCELDESMLVIADAAKPVAIAGIMGGLNTEVCGTTTNVLIEAAQFDPLSIRRTSRKLQLMSDSNYRFERGVDPVALDEASLRACQLIIQIAGGELAEGVVDVWANPFVAPEVALRPQRCDKVLGVDVPAERQQEILARLGLRPRQEGGPSGRIVCTIPSYRADLTREIDLIEEVARIEGYDKIPVRDKIAHPVVPDNLPTRVRRLAGQALAACGFDEAITFTFIDQAEADLIGAARTVAVDKLNRKTNNVLRPSLLPSLLRACKNNQGVGNADVHLFEIANCFPGSAAGHLPDEYVELGMVSTGDIAQLRGALETVVERLAPAAQLTVRAAPAPHLEGGTAAAVMLNGEPIGTLGRVAQAVQDHYGLEKPIAAAAVRFEAILHAACLTRAYQPVPKFPPVRRDLSIIVDDGVTWQELSDVISGLSQPLREALEYVTTYRGKPIPAGRKSVTVTLSFRAPDRTLRGEEVDEQIQQVLAALRGRFNAELRT